MMRYFPDISIPISCDISNDIDMRLHVNIHRKLNIRRYDVCVRSGREMFIRVERCKPETKASVYKLTVESASQPACCRLHY